MPAMLDDPEAPTIYRASGEPPFPDPQDTQPHLPADVYPRQVTLRDRITVATIVPFSSKEQLPPSLLAYLSDQLNKEIDMGDTYPMIDTMPKEKFGSYWFQNFGGVMLLGNIETLDEVFQEKDWSRECLGSFYIKPNYPGRSSHVCNGGFLVTDAARNKGVGRLMGEAYLEWAPRLGYTYSIFNLVYETNVASCRIWDALGFKRVGRVKGAGNLKSYPGQLIDAIIYGRDLGAEGAEFVSEERFDKIAFYLRYGKYPAGADRAEKSRLRSAATHYKLLPNDKLMLKDKEVISDPQKQYEIARSVHRQQHGGINKTTAIIAEKFHWVRIKETVSLVIKNCDECKELGKAPVVRPDGVTPRRSMQSNLTSGVSAAGRILSLPEVSPPESFPEPQHRPTSVSPQVLNRTLPGSSRPSNHSRLQADTPMRHIGDQLEEHQASSPHPHPHQRNICNDYMPLDPRIMEDVQHQLSYHSHNTVQSPSHNNLPSFNEHHDLDSDRGADDSFHAMLSGDNDGGNRLSHGDPDADANADLDMLIDHGDDEEVEREKGDKGTLEMRAEVAVRAAEEALRSHDSDNNLQNEGYRKE